MNEYLVQLKGNGIESNRVMTAKGLFGLMGIKPEFMEIYFISFVSSPRRMRWGYDGVTLWIYDRYGNIFDKYSKGDKS